MGVRCRRCAGLEIQAGNATPATGNRQCKAPPRAGWPVAGRDPFQIVPFLPSSPAAGPVSHRHGVRHRRLQPAIGPRPRDNAATPGDRACLRKMNAAQGAQQHSRGSGRRRNTARAFRVPTPGTGHVLSHDFTPPVHVAAVEPHSTARTRGNKITSGTQDNEPGSISLFGRYRACAVGAYFHAPNIRLREPVTGMSGMSCLTGMTICMTYLAVICHFCQFFGSGQGGVCLLFSARGQHKHDN
jgi:hypothetical protein